MRIIKLLSVIFALLLFYACGTEEQQEIVDSGLTDTGTAFNPKAWYGKTRREMAKLIPQISNVDQDISGGPFLLTDQMGLKSIIFTFEHSEKDARLLNLNVDFAEPVTISQAVKTFGVNIQGITPQKTRRYWLFPVNKPLIHSFMVKLKPSDPDSTPLTTASIAYRLN